MSEGRIQKALSGFYYVDTGTEVLSCRARGKFRREGISPLVGDRVEVRELGNGEGFVEKILPRKNAFTRCLRPARYATSSASAARNSAGDWQQRI